MQIEKIISFNTGRAYSDKGQRIAAAVAPSGAVIMVDIDRGIECSIYGIDLDRSEIMWNYDRGNTINVSNLDFMNEHSFKEMNDFIKQLQDHAAAFPACTLKTKCEVNI